MRLLSHPVLCNYYVTYRCNATCSFCDIWEKPSPYVLEEDVVSNLTDLKQLGVKVIDFTGGEPLLHQKLPRFLLIAKELGFITTVTTNTLLYPKFANALKGLVDMLHFSLDAASKEEHNTSRGVNCYDTLIESVQIAKNIGERPDILFTVFNHNIQDIDAVYEKFVQEEGLVLILNPVFSYNGVNDVDQLTSSSLDIITNWGKKKGVYLNQAFVELISDGGNQITDPVCKAASSTIVISPMNELVVPCYHLGEYSMPIEGNLKKIYLSDQVQNWVQQEGRLNKCQGCTINCYMQPSFAVEMNKYWFKALPSTIKYNLMKSTWKQLFVEGL